MGTNIYKNKVFVVGFHKTGTTSIHHLFLQMGLSSFHGCGWRKLQNKHLFNKYTCFSDGHPHDLNYLRDAFPNSKYIMQTRSLESWIYSKLNHFEEKGRLPPDYVKKKNLIKEWIESRNATHLKYLRSFKKHNDKYLLINYIDDRLVPKK